MVRKRRSTWHILGILTVVFSVALVLSAWNWHVPGFGETEALAEEDPVAVTVADDSLFLSTTSLSSGSVAFEVSNEGSGPHSFAITGPVEARLEGEVAAGETKTLESSLEPGTYTAYCPVEGHGKKESVEFTVGR